MFCSRTEVLMEFFQYYPQRGQYFREYTPEPGKTINCYVHQMLSYRYNWHHQYELEFVLRGSMKTGAGGRSRVFHEDDFFIINPLVGHASLALEPNTLAMTLHFPMDAFSTYIPEGMVCRFDCATDETTRSSPAAAVIRHMAAVMMRSAMNDDERQFLSAYEGLKLSLYTMLEPRVEQDSAVNINAEHEQKIAEMIGYIKQHYAEKITLEEVAERFGYNRTYVSTFFKKNCGISFYDYLTMIRLSESIERLGDMDVSLTQTALESGFPDLKTFNRLFRENFGQLPADYRAEHRTTIMRGKGVRFLEADNRLADEKLESYILRL